MFHDHKNVCFVEYLYKFNVINETIKWFENGV